MEKEFAFASTKEFATAKQRAQCREEANEVQEKSLVCRSEDSLHHNEELHQGKGRKHRKKTRVFAKTNDSSPKRRRSSWDKNTSIFSQIIGPFSKGINTNLVIDIEEDLKVEHFPFLWFLSIGSNF